MSNETGWKCPRCGRVYAPWMPECRPCNGPTPKTNEKDIRYPSTPSSSDPLPLMPTTTCGSAL